MRSTGIVRRIDELGRVVIPKEIRRTMRIREGEELEVFTAEDDSLILRKYSAVREMNNVAEEYASALYRTNGFTAIITDNDSIIAVSGDIKAYKIGQKINKKCDSLLRERKHIVLSGGDLAPLFEEQSEDIKSIAFSPIMNAGDVLGAVIAVSKGNLSDNALKIIETASLFIASQL